MPGCVLVQVHKLIPDSVNSIFNPEFIDNLYTRSPTYRSSLIADAKATNYGVVRLELIEHLYERMYEQRRSLGADETEWPHRILGATDIAGVDAVSQDKLRLRVKSLRELEASETALDVDLVIAATGYQRKAHLTMMDQGIADLLPNLSSNTANDANGTSRVAIDVKKSSGIEQKDVKVARDYSVQFGPGKVAQGSGLWLQGCNELTHGVRQPSALECSTLLTVI